MDINRIYHVAEKHFFAKQYNDVKLDNIANDLGIKKPSLYYYFENKKDFYIKTLQYSMKKYVTEQKKISKTKNTEAFISWYLDYPSRETNLFAIATHMGYGEDKEINRIINKGKIIIDKENNNFLKTFNLRPISIYLVIQLMDKLAMENCIDEYCLDYDIKALTKEIIKFIKNCINYQH